jgi:hypothetical protein
MALEKTVKAADQTSKEVPIMAITSEGFQPFDGIQPQANNSDGGFTLPVGDGGTGYELLPTAWYRVEVSGADNDPSKTGKKMLTLSLRAENQQTTGQIRAYLGSWNTHLYIGLCHMAGVDPKAGFPNLGVLKGVSGYAYIKLETNKDGRISSNVTNFLTRDKMLREGHRIPELVAEGGGVMADHHPDDDAEALA